jgi:hypothetical protein
MEYSHKYNINKKKNQCISGITLLFTQLSKVCIPERHKVYRSQVKVGIKKAETFLSQLFIFLEFNKNYSSLVSIFQSTQVSFHSETGC